MSETERQRQLAQTSASRTIRQLEADGLRWTVSEMPAPLFDRRGGTHLVFDGEMVMRRVRVFPADWFDLPDDALYALTEHIPR